MTRGSSAVGSLSVVPLLFGAVALLAVAGAGCSDDGSYVPVVPDGEAPDSRVDGGIDPDGQADAVRPDGTLPADGPVLPCTLKVALINGEQPAAILRIDDTLDRDEVQDGVQLDVEVDVIGKPDGTQITLEVTGLSPSPVVQSSGNKALFLGVTVDPEATPVVTFEPKAAGCSGTAISYNTQARPTCQIVAPVDGAVLYSKDDKIPGNGSFDFDVIVSTTNAASGQVDLAVEGVQAVAGVVPDATGVASFPTVVLPPTPTKKVTLEATVRVGDLSGTCVATITVDTDAPSCALSGFSPQPVPTSKGDGFGPLQDADPTKPGIQTTLTVTSGGDAVELLVNEVPHPAGIKIPVGGQVTFDLDLGEGASVVYARCVASSTGNTGESNRANLLVDTVPPDPVDDLSCEVANHREGEIRCTFTGPGDGPDGSGVEACLVHHRVSGSSIDDSNFDAADTVKATHAVTPGVVNTVVTTGLKLLQSYDFAVKCVDYLGNVSPISTPDVPVMELNFKVTELVGTVPDGHFGSPAVTGDFNCDGLSDLAIGLPRANNERGEVHIFFSDGKGFPPTFSTKITGTRLKGLFGTELAALDFDKDPDGCTDLLVWSPEPGGAGSAYLFLGDKIWLERSDIGTPLTAPAEFAVRIGNPGQYDFIQAIGVVDLDGDSHDDMVFTRLDFVNDKATVALRYGQAGVAKATVGTAPTELLIPVHMDLLVTGATAADVYGLPLAQGGDLDGDQYGELLIGIPFWKYAGQQRGAVDVLLGGPRSSSQEVIDANTSTRLVRITGEANNNRFGLVAAGVGDTNGDGIAEFLVADSFFGTNDINAGRCYLFSLVPTIPVSTADALAVIANDFVDPVKDNFLGRRIANGARLDPAKGVDLNNDGLADIVVGMQYMGSSPAAAALVFFGKTGPHADRGASQADLVLQPAGATRWFSRELGFVRDFDGDGFYDLFVSDSHFDGGVGRTLIYH